jgi:Rpp20 subunit of nuclear RNase MRP and P
MFLRCRKLLESGKYEAIYLHGLGKAVDRAINIALQLKVTSGSAALCKPTVSLSANTSTVDLIDDLEPADDDHEPATRTRKSSAIHIKVSHDNTDNLEKYSSDQGRARMNSSAANTCAVGGTTKAETRQARENQLSISNSNTSNSVQHSGNVSGSKAPMTGKKKPKDFKTS